MTATIYSWTPITKSEKQDDGTLLVYGPAATSALDRDSQRLDASWLDVAMPRWMADDGGGGAVREQHDSKRAVGVGVGLSKTDDGVHMLAARIVDPIAVKKIEYGVLKGFSVGIKNPKVVMGKADAPNGLVTDGDVIEVSVVDRPANPECLFQMAKSDSTGELTLVEDPQVVEKSPTYGLPPELFDRLASPVKQALADLAASGAQVAAEVEPPAVADTAKSETPDPLIPVVVNVTVSGTVVAESTLAEVVAAEVAAYAPLDKAYSAKEKRDALAAGQAMENANGDPSYTIKTKSDLRKAIKAVGRGNADHDSIRAHIVKRAAALGLEAMVPENWNKDGSLKDETATKADADPEMVEKAEALLREVRALVPDLAKADDGDDAGDEDESQDIAGAQEAISAIAKLIVSEAESLAMGNLNEACDIALLLDAVRALKWFQANERNEQSGLDDTVMMLADAPVEGEDLLKAEGKNGGKLAPPFKKKDAKDDGADEDGSDDAADDDGSDSEDDGKPAAKKTATKADAPVESAPVAEPPLTKSEAAEIVKAAVAAALAADAAEPETSPDPEPETVTKAELEDLVKTAVAQAREADQERIASLTADLTKATGDIEAIKAMPLPGGPVLTRTAAQQGEATKSDAQRLLAEADALMAKADAFPANRDLAEGYRDRARVLRAKALA